MTTRNLLVIEDDADNRTLIKFALEHIAGWKVLTAVDGIEGITMAETQRPDVILLDFMMPSLDGLDVLDILKSNLFTCSIPVIFITAMVQTKLLSQLDNSLAVGIITKPFKIIDLDFQIAEIFRWDRVDSNKLI